MAGTRSRNVSASLNVSPHPLCFVLTLTARTVCNTPKKCVFARVVDTCAGCKKNTKHVDLTKAAFGQLADFDEGKLKVQYRQATQPDEW